MRGFGFDSFPSIWLEHLEPYEMGLAIGARFATMIQERLAEDPHLRSELLPFAASAEGQQLIEQITATNKKCYPRYWEELRGIADGSSAPFLDVLLLNFRKEVSPFLPKDVAQLKAEAAEAAEECSDVLVSRQGLSIIAHNEDANVSVHGRAFMVHASLPDGITFTAYTYAGELPTCAFGFNSFGIAFTLNAVPLDPTEVVPGGIGRNFVSRDLLESKNLSDALERLQNFHLSAGHSYNLMDVHRGIILNVETASKGRCSILEISDPPYFHANMYRRLEVPQVPNESSVHRERRAASMRMSSKEEILCVLGDDCDQELPIYMSGPTLYTMCTVILDASTKIMSLYLGNPKDPKSEQFNVPLVISKQVPEE